VDVAAADGALLMGILRRLFGGPVPDAPDVPADPGDPADPAELDALERDHELDNARAEQERLDELQQRQLRYAEYAWQPPAQGGERRAEDDDKSAGG
jgi:hypothetical protein